LVLEQELLFIQMRVKDFVVLQLCMEHQLRIRGIKI